MRKVMKKYLKLIIIMLLGATLYGCGYFGPGMADYDYYLSDQYLLIHAGTTSIWKENTSEKAVGSDVVGIAWDENWILAKQVEGDSDFYWWIIDLNTDEKYGPLNEFNFADLKTQFNIGSELILESPEKYKALEKTQPVQKQREIDDYNQTDSKERGNTVGNLMNHGLAVAKDEWIHYSNAGDGGKLYKVKVDGTNKAKLADDRVQGINVVGDWIYYINESDERKIYRLNRNGSDRQKLTNERTISTLTVLGNWMYFSTERLQKVSIDGKVKIRKLSAVSYQANLVDDWFYYTNSIDNGTLYKVKTDGSFETKLNDAQCAWINVSGDWVYYSNLSDGGKLYKTKTDGSENIKLSDDTIALLNVNGEWAYYQKYSNKTYSIEKMKLDGSGKQVLKNNKFVLSLNIADNWIYYSYYLNDKYEDGLVTYRVNLDGTKEEPVQ